MVLIEPAEENSELPGLRVARHADPFRGSMFRATVEHTGSARCVYGKMRWGRQFFGEGGTQPLTLARNQAGSWIRGRRRSPQWTAAAGDEVSGQTRSLVRYKG